MNRKQAEKSQRSRVKTDVEEASGSSPGLEGTQGAPRHSRTRRCGCDPFSLKIPLRWLPRRTVIKVLGLWPLPVGCFPFICPGKEKKKQDMSPDSFIISGFSLLLLCPFS